jgi:hypothetical protein
MIILCIGLIQARNVAMATLQLRRRLGRITRRNYMSIGCYTLTVFVSRKAIVRSVKKNSNSDRQYAIACGRMLRNYS